MSDVGQLSLQQQWVVRLLNAGERLKQHIDRPQSTPKEIYNSMLSLSRCVDQLVMSGHKLEKAHEFFLVIKQTWKYAQDQAVRPALVVLLLSVKGACTAGWFGSLEMAEVLQVLNHVLRQFTENSPTPQPVLPASKQLPPSSSAANDFVAGGKLLTSVLQRFCPRLRPTAMLMAMEAKAGYQMLVCDFHVARQLNPEEAVRLFVCRSDDTSTSSCLVTPPHASFVMNGRGVPGRTLLHPDKSPQMPTDVTKSVRLGANLLQVVGDFAAPHTVVVALMAPRKWDAASVKLLPGEKPPQKPVPGPEQQTEDDDLQEGPSRTSLNCPISHLRIKTPVKGVPCRHHQCFDYDNFVAINECRPAWRCPCCNAPLTCQDLRLDVQTAKVLEEVRDDRDVADVLIFPSGTWRPVRPKRNPDSSASEDARPSAKRLRGEGASSSDTGAAEVHPAVNAKASGPLIIDLSDVESDDEMVVDQKPPAEKLTQALNGGGPAQAVQGGWTSGGTVGTLLANGGAAQAVPGSTPSPVTGHILALAAPCRTTSGRQGGYEAAVPRRGREGGVAASQSGGQGAARADPAGRAMRGSPADELRGMGPQPAPSPAVAPGAAQPRPGIAQQPWQTGGHPQQQQMAAQQMAGQQVQQARLAAGQGVQMASAQVPMAAPPLGQQMAMQQHRQRQQQHGHQPQQRVYLQVPHHAQVVQSGTACQQQQPQAQALPTPQAPQQGHQLALPQPMHQLALQQQQQQQQEPQLRGSWQQQQQAAIPQQRQQSHHLPIPQLQPQPGLVSSMQRSVATSSSQLQAQQPHLIATGVGAGALGAGNHHQVARGQASGPASGGSHAFVAFPTGPWPMHSSHNQTQTLLFSGDYQAVITSDQMVLASALGGTSGPSQQQAMVGQIRLGGNQNGNVGGLAAGGSMTPGQGVHPSQVGLGANWNLPGGTMSTWYGGAQGEQPGASASPGWGELLERSQTQVSPSDFNSLFNCLSSQQLTSQHVSGRFGSSQRVAPASRYSSPTHSPTAWPRAQTSQGGGVAWNGIITSQPQQGVFVDLDAPENSVPSFEGLTGQQVPLPAATAGQSDFARADKQVTAGNELVDCSPFQGSLGTDPGQESSDWLQTFLHDQAI